jgi:hypothetical protein
MAVTNPQVYFKHKPKGRKLLKYDRVIKSCELSSRFCVFKCFSDDEEINLTFPSQFTALADNFVSLPIEEDFGNLKKGFLKIINLGKKDVVISHPEIYEYKNPKKNPVNNVRISYCEDKYFLKMQDKWFIY